jgi:ribulose-phosphate 3-epimerase
MSVNPGFGGQQFIQRTYDKVSRLKDMILEQNLSILIEVDGGVNSENAPLLAKAGADAVVAGNFVFSAADPLQAIASLK